MLVENLNILPIQRALEMLHCLIQTHHKAINYQIGSRVFFS